jgi:SAM-dependent methyltransferase
MINSFTGLHARYYDLVYGDKPYDEEARFVLARLEGVLGRRPNTLLDLACGTGRHAVEFVELGIDVTGVDVNPELIERARDRLPGAEFVVQNMAELDLGEARFDAVTCLFDSIGYPQDNEHVLATLAGARRHLVDSGAITLEFLHAPAMLLNAAPVRVKRWSTDDGRELIRISETRLDVERSVMDVSYELVELRADGSYEHSRERQANRFFSVPEMGALLGSAGLELEDAVAAYHPDGEADANAFHILATARVAAAP